MKSSPFFGLPLPQKILSYAATVHVSFNATCYIIDTVCKQRPTSCIPPGLINIKQ